ncbi:unnamed protein product [Schistosoma mattheei]|uniref:Uncharacterized protein n=1 Tax=Schistosoma mattheei TaxID=31246 RepID=A0A183PN08_9TREM|nr:unnamed protein product [Schistosoma mattheei]
MDVSNGGVNRLPGERLLDPEYADDIVLLYDNTQDIQSALNQLAINVRRYAVTCVPCEQAITLENIASSYCMADVGFWSSSAPFIWNQGFTNRLDGSSISTNPIKALDIHFSSSQFRKQQPCQEKVMSRSSLSMIVCT